MSRQTKSPSLAQDLRMLGDVYLTLGWLAMQRLRQGRQWPWYSRTGGRATVVALPRPGEEGPDSDGLPPAERG